MIVFLQSLLVRPRVESVYYRENKNFMPTILYEENYVKRKKEQVDKKKENTKNNFKHQKFLGIILTFFQNV